MLLVTMLSLLLPAYHPQAAFAACVPPPPGMVAWWPADGNFKDIQNGHDGSPAGDTTFTTGVVDEAFIFDGSDDSIGVPDDPALRITGTVSIDFWAKRQELDRVDVVMEKGGDWTLGQTNYGVGLNENANDNMFYFIYANGGMGVDGVTDLEWHHYAVVATNGASSSTGQFYIDGVLQSVTHFFGNPTINLNTDASVLHIGSQIGPPKYNSSLAIDELELFDRALLATEIQAIYEAGSDGKCKPTLQLTSALSRKTHNNAGDFDLPLVLDPSTNATVEPRNGGPTQLIFTFSGDIVAADGTIDANEFTITNATFSSASISGNQLTLNLSGVIDQSVVTIVLHGLEDTSGNALGGDNDVAIRALFADVNQDQVVDRSDFALVVQHQRESVDNNNFLLDIDLDGLIRRVDGYLVKQNRHHTVP